MNIKKYQNRTQTNNGRFIKQKINKNRATALERTATGLNAFYRRQTVTLL